MVDESSRGRRGTGLAGALAVLCALVALALGGTAGAATFVQEWGGSGGGSGQFQDPFGVAIDTAGNVYVVDSFNDRVQKFTEAGVFLQEWDGTGEGSEQGALFSPAGVAVDTSGYVYVADRGNDRVVKFTVGGAFVDTWGTRGGNDNQFLEPEGIAVGATGNVFVADTGNDRVKQFTNTGTFVSDWGTTGSAPDQFLGPNAIAVDAAGNAYVSDSGNNRVQKFSTAPIEFLSQFGGAGAGPGQFNFPAGLALDSAGTVYVSDHGGNRVQAFDSAGGFISHFGSEGTGPGQFHGPLGIAAGAGGKIFVADSGNNRIQVFGPDPIVVPPTPLPPGGLPAPAYGKTVNLSLVSGIVKVKLPGSKKFVLLTADQQIPVGTIIDARKGKVLLTSAKGPGGGTQSAVFFSGVFKVLQPKKGKPITVLKLQDPPVCGTTKHLMATASKKKGSGLWGSGKGNFRSEGKHGSATVRGTIWWAQDICDGTLFKVKKGVVTIKDFTSGKTLKIHAGQKYLAPAG
jgi:DNA-binding beta-propeller fold protein YncE